MGREFVIRKQFITLIAVIFATNIVIFLNIPVLRQIFSFFSFTIIPGLLILHILKLNEIDSIKKFLLSVGLSISFLMFIGLLINYLYLLFGYSTPLSTLSLTISFSIIVLLLCFIAWQRNKDNFYFVHIDICKIKNQLKSPFLLPLLFPFLSVLGSYLKNTTGNNAVLICMLSSILIYTILLTCLNKRVPQAAWPLTIWMMSLALLLMQGLATNYLSPGDIYPEYRGLKVSAKNLSWSMTAYFSPMTACLSTSLLPTVYRSLLGVTNLCIPKVVYPLIASLIPLACYAIYRNYLSPVFSFLSSFFFIAQLHFIYTVTDHMRLEICLLFFVLYILLIFERAIKGWKKSAILLIFLFSIVVTYYALPVIFFYLLLCLAVASKLLKGHFRSTWGVSSSMVALCGSGIFIWWNQLTYPMFSSYVYRIERTFQNLGNLFVEELHHEEIQTMTRISGIPLPDTVNIIIHYFAFVCIVIGVIALVIEALRGKHKIFDVPYLVSMLAMLALAAAFVILPYISTAYGTLRLYETTLVILAPAAIIGITTIISFVRTRIRKKHHDKLISERNLAGMTLVLVLVFLTVQFLCVSGLLHQASGIPFSEYLNTEGDRHNVMWIYDSEVEAAGWLYENTNERFSIVTDWGNPPVGIFGFVTEDMVEGVRWRRGLFPHGEQHKDSYIFLRHANLESGLLYSNGVRGKTSNLSEYSYILESRNKIYAGGSEVWR
jgi:uncharacterized membrane protein